MAISPDVLTLYEAWADGGTRADIASAITRFMVGADGSVYSDEPLTDQSRDALGALWDRLGHDESLAWLADTSWAEDVWVSRIAFASQRVDPVADGPGPFCHLPWKPRFGLWTSPRGATGHSLWWEYLAGRGEAEEVSRETVLDRASRGGSHLLSIRTSHEMAELIEHYRHPGGGLAWRSVAAEFDGVSFSWRAVLEGVVTALLQPDGPPPLNGLGVASALWFDPDAFVIGAARSE